MLRFFRQSPKTQLPPEVESIFERLNRLLNDEKMQIQRLPELLRVEVLRGADCDHIPGAVGDSAAILGTLSQLTDLLAR